MESFCSSILFLRQRSVREYSKIFLGSSYAQSLGGLGATTLSITTLSITTCSVTIFSVKALSIMTLNITILAIKMNKMQHPT
jgi:hypothetical protein